MSCIFVRSETFQTTLVQWVSEMKYLTVVLDQKMTWKAQADHVTNNLSHRSNIETISEEEEQPRLA